MRVVVAVLSERHRPHPSLSPRSWGEGDLLHYAACGIDRPDFLSAAQTAAPVAGMATASVPIASVMALMSAAGAAIAPASPQPLMPSGLDGHLVTVVSDRQRRQMIGARHAIVHERAGHELAVLVVDRALAQRLADALGDAAVDLALDDHRVDHHAEIIDRGPGHDLGVPGVGIDLDLADVAAGREGEVGRIVERTLLETRFKLLAIEFVGDVGVERHVAPGGRLVGAGDAEFSVLELDVALGGFEHVGGDLLRLGLDLVERLDDRRHADGARARAVGAHAELHLVGVAMHDGDVVNRDAEPVADQLAQRWFRGPDRGCASR